MQETVKFMIACDEGARDYLSKEIVALGSAPPRISDAKGLGGDIAGFLVAGTIGVNATVALLNLIGSAIKLGMTIRTVKIDEKTLSNPTEQEVKDLVK